MKLDTVRFSRERKSQVIVSLTMEAPQGGGQGAYQQVTIGGAFESFVKCTARNECRCLNEQVASLHARVTPVKSCSLQVAGKKREFPDVAIGQAPYKFLKNGYDAWVVLDLFQTLRKMSGQVFVIIIENGNKTARTFLFCQENSGVPGACSRHEWSPCIFNYPGGKLIGC